MARVNQSAAIIRDTTDNPFLAADACFLEQIDNHRDVQAVLVMDDEAIWTHMRDHVAHGICSVVRLGGDEDRLERALQLVRRDGFHRNAHLAPHAVDEHAVGVDRRHVFRPFVDKGDVVAVAGHVGPCEAANRACANDCHFHQSNSQKRPPDGRGNCFDRQRVSAAANAFKLGSCGLCIGLGFPRSWDRGRVTGRRAPPRA